MLKTSITFAACLLLPSLAFADGHGHHKHHGHHDHLMVERVVQYVPAPAPVLAPAPRYRSYDQRSATGLVGGALGSAVGYEMSKGDPLGAGLGAAAGAWIGNGIGR